MIGLESFLEFDQHPLFDEVEDAFTQGEEVTVDGEEEGDVDGITLVEGEVQELDQTFVSGGSFG